MAGRLHTITACANYYVTVQWVNVGIKQELADKLALRFPWLLGNKKMLMSLLSFFFVKDFLIHQGFHPCLHPVRSSWTQAAEHDSDEATTRIRNEGSLWSFLHLCYPKPNTGQGCLGNQVGNVSCVAWLKFDVAWHSNVDVNLQLGAHFVWLWNVTALK